MAHQMINKSKNTMLSHRAYAWLPIQVTEHLQGVAGHKTGQMRHETPYLRECLVLRQFSEHNPHLQGQTRAFVLAQEPAISFIYSAHWRIELP